MDNKQRIGFMQGYLSSHIGEAAQFPWDSWQQEFSDAYQYGFPLLEWYIDSYNLYNNPLLNVEGREQIVMLKSQLEIEVSSVIVECFRSKPFYKPMIWSRQYDG